MEKAFFKNIRQTILEELSLAKNSIKIAVAWFTNEELFLKICEKAKNGLDVEVIIIDDYINNSEYSLNFQKFINFKGRLRYGKNDFPIHHKFCIIDESVLINGSYNWTYYSENRNEENIIVSKNNRFLIDQYINEYKRLTSILSLVKNPIKRSINDIKIIDYFATKEYLGYDLYYHGKQNNKIKFIETAARILPKNLLIQKEFKKTSKVEFIKKTITSLGIESIMYNKDGRFSIHIRKGTTVPYNKSKQYFTVYDNQTEIQIETYKGFYSFVKYNQQIGSFLITGLPALPAGKASITVSFNLLENGVLTVVAENNSTGNKMEVIYNVEQLVF